MSNQEQQQPSIHEIMSRQSKCFADLVKLLRQAGTLTIRRIKTEGVERFSIDTAVTTSVGQSLEEVITAAMILRAGSAVPIVTHGTAQAGSTVTPEGDKLKADVKAAMQKVLDRGVLVPGEPITPAQEKERVYGHLYTGVKSVEMPSTHDEMRDAARRSYRQQKLINGIGELVGCKLGDDVIDGVRAMVDEVNTFRELLRRTRLSATNGAGRVDIVANVEEAGVVFSFHPVAAINVKGA